MEGRVRNVERSARVRIGKRIVDVVFQGNWDKDIGDCCDDMALIGNI